MKLKGVFVLLLFTFPFNHGLGVKKCCLDGQLLDAETLLCVPNTLPPERMTHFLPSYMINMTSEDLMTMQSKVHKNIQSGHMPQCQRWEDDEHSVWNIISETFFEKVFNFISFLQLVWTTRFDQTLRVPYIHRWQISVFGRQIFAFARPRWLLHRNGIFTEPIDFPFRSDMWSM